MQEVTKQEFRDVYFRLGGGEASGWGRRYWEKFFEADPVPPMKYLVEAPATPQHTRMMIVSDFGTRQHRLFFLTEEDEERLFDHPGRD